MGFTRPDYWRVFTEETSGMKSYMGYIFVTPKATHFNLKFCLSDEKNKPVAMIFRHRQLSENPVGDRVFSFSRNSGRPIG